jgi:hypothetical protein
MQNILIKEKPRINLTVPDAFQPRIGGRNRSRRFLG